MIVYFGNLSSPMMGGVVSISTLIETTLNNARVDLLHSFWFFFDATEHQRGCIRDRYFNFRFCFQTVTDKAKFPETVD